MPSEPTPPSTTSHSATRPRDARAVLGAALMVTGGVFVLIAVLTVANAGYGARPTREFSQRRSYNMVKTDVFRAFPRFILQAGSGLLVVWAGLRLRKKSEVASTPVPPRSDADSPE